MVVWIGEARYFSHQDRLTLEVACLLGGEKVQSPISKAMNSVPAIAPQPSGPPDGVLKKIELSIEQAADVLPPPWRAQHEWSDREVCPDFASSDDATGW